MLKKPRVPTADEVFEAMMISHQWEEGPMRVPREKVEWALDVENSLWQDPLWSGGNVVLKCPLCGYETTVTNVCRNCPEAPIIEGWKHGHSWPQPCMKHGISHWRFDENGKLVWLTHATVAMYVVRNDDGSPLTPELWDSVRDILDDSIVDPQILKQKEAADDDRFSQMYALTAEIHRRLTQPTTQ